MAALLASAVALIKARRSLNSFCNIALCLVSRSELRTESASTVALPERVNDAADSIEVMPLAPILSAGDAACMSADIADVAENAETSATQTNNLVITAPPREKTGTPEHAAWAGR
jgi:hypothetical protein